MEEFRKLVSKDGVLDCRYIPKDQEPMVLARDALASVRPEIGEVEFVKCYRQLIRDGFRPQDALLSRL